MTIQTPTTIPLVDLRQQHDEVRSEIDRALAAALDDSGFIGGVRVRSFESSFASYLGSNHVLGVSNGTDALEFALRAIGVGRGDVIITTPHTFIATIEGAIQLGAEPRFVDIDATSFNLDADLLRAYLAESCERGSDGSLREHDTGQRIAAIVPVHLYGLPADLTPILAAAAEYGLPVVEDAAQAHGATYRLPDGHWARVGTLGDVGCFSFYPGKNLGAIGEGGAIATNNRAVADRVALYRDHGQSERYVHVSADGVNGRLDAIQAAVLEIKLACLDRWNEARRTAAQWYAEDLAGSDLVLPTEPSNARHVYHIYAVRVAERERVRACLAEAGIATGLHYPIALHRQPGLAELGYSAGSFPEAERAAAEELSLPMYPHLSREQVSYVAAQLRDALR